MFRRTAHHALLGCASDQDLQGLQTLTRPISMKPDIQFFVLWNICLSVCTCQVSGPGDGRSVTVRIGKVSICFLFVFVTSGAFADAVLDQARELMGRQQAAGAFALLDPLE